MIKILFVCTGNICRSPSAEAVLRHAVEKAGKSHLFSIDSAGTHGYHVGEKPDVRAIKAAQGRGISMDGIVARKIVRNDFDDFDHIVALDQGHYQILARQQTQGSKAALTLFMDYCQNYGDVKDVPDPYYGDVSGFDRVLDMLEEGVEGILKTFAA